MFDTDPAIGARAMANRQRDRANFNADQSNLHLMRLEQWRDHARRLEVENASLHEHINQMAAVRTAENEALAAVTAEWRKTHPVSVLHDFVRKFKDGRGMRRNVAIWIDTFDAAARRLGIRNPETWRIS